MNLGSIVDLARVRAARERLDRAAARWPALTAPPERFGVDAWIDTLQHDLEAMTEAQTLGIEDVAALIGCHPETIRRAIRAGELAAVRLRRNYRVSRPELARWWAAQGGGQLFDDCPAPLPRPEEEPAR